MQTAERLEAPVLPERYVAFDNVDLCSNRLLDVSAWIVIDRYAPILVGQGERGPRLWLYAPLHRSDRWQPIVEDNDIISKAVGPYEPVSLRSEPDTRHIALDIGGFPVLRCAELEQGNLRVQLIDLAPLGLVIKGTTEAGLYMGPVNTRNKTYRNLQFAFAAC
jgi:hypothetical protein